MNPINKRVKKRWWIESKFTTLIKKIKKRQTTYKSVITIIYSRCRCWTESYTPASIYLLKVNNRNTRTMCEICLKLTIKTPEGCQVSFWWNRNNKNTLPSNFFYLQWKLACVVVNNLLWTYLLISQEKKTIQLKSVSYFQWTLKWFKRITMVMMMTMMMNCFCGMVD